MAGLTPTINRFHEGSYLVYFNGIEIPATAVSVTSGVWQIPTATVSVVPDATLAGIGREDRMHVAIFYLDDVYTPNDPQFRLLFDGEITGWSYSNTARGRSMNFACISQLAILEEIYPYFVTGLDSMLTSTIQATNANQAVFSHAGLTFPSSLLYNGFDQSIGNGLKRPYDIVENILRALIGSTAQQQLGSAVSAGFYGRYMRRSNMVNRWVPSPLLEDLNQNPSRGLFPVVQAVQSESIINALSQQISQVGNAGSFWGVLQQLFNMVYYEIIAIPNATMAKVRMGGTSPGLIIGPPTWNSSGQISAGNPFQLASEPNRLMQFITKPQWLFGIPPMCNAIFPSMIQELSYSEDYRSQPTRMGINDEFLLTLNPSGMNTNMAPFAVLHGGYPQAYADELERKFGQFNNNGDILRSGKNFLIWPEEYFKGPLLKQERLPNWFNYIDDALTMEQRSKMQPTETSTNNNATATQSDQVQNSPDLYQKRKQLMTAFAHYEYVRQRGAAKRGGVNMVFNPYVVPGFPTIIFSDVPSNQNYHAYVTTVTHTMTASSMGTQLGFTFAQTLDDLIYEVDKVRKTKDFTDGKLPGVIAAPLNPLESVRNASQLTSGAADYYRQLFYHNLSFQGELKQPIFDYRYAIDFVFPSGERESIIKNGAYNPNTFDNLQRYTSTAPSKLYESIFQNTDDAMRLVARPICTLEEYINFQGERGERTGAIPPTAGGRVAKGAVYYTKILSLKQGPGTEPVPYQVTNTPTAGNSAVFDYDTRADWETRLLNYRKKVIEQLFPQEA